jgi:hypothetical protein
MTKKTTTTPTNTASVSAATDSAASTAKETSDNELQEVERQLKTWDLQARQRARRQIAITLMGGLMFRDGTSKSPAGQAQAAIAYAEELLAQLEARELEEGAVLTATRTGL